jgi:hypothetical protein
MLEPTPPPPRGGGGGGGVGHRPDVPSGCSALKFGGPPQCIALSKWGAGGVANGKKHDQARGTGRSDHVLDLV